MEITRISLVKIHALMSSVHAKYNKLPDQQKPIALIVATLVGCLAIVILCKCLLAIFINKKMTPAEPLVIRQNNSISIPKHSPLRNQLQITTVKMSASPHIVTFPGIVEANPSRTVNVLPPLPGRLITLNAKLGDYVEKNQVLAVIRSPGLAQAYSDRNKALRIASEITSYSCAITEHPIMGVAL